MDNFYEILGVSRSATSTEIRAAYKRLALKYHPDRNPGFPEAEEVFKQVNEAYHTLSDPQKKLNYDNRFILPPPARRTRYAQEMSRRRKFWYWYWQQHQQDRPYKLDKEYFKIQALAFLVFIVISGFCFGLVHTGSYIIERRQLEKWRENSLSLKQVNALFVDGRFEDAFRLIQQLKQNDPYEFRFAYARDSLVSELRNLADNEFMEKNFSGAVSHYLTLKLYEQPVRFETIRRISLCQYYLGNFKESLQALKQLHNQRPRDLELVYQIGVINLEKLENPEEALYYFTLGKKLFKRNLTEVYGEAFELILEPADAPDIYFDIFVSRAKANMLMKKYYDASTDCNWAVFLRPTKGEPYLLRAKAYAELNRRDKVCPDLNAAKIRGMETSRELVRRFCQ